MKYSVGLIGLLALTACAGASPSGTGAGAGGAGGGTPTPADNAAFGTLLNNVRLANGQANVTFDARLATAAQGHSDDMLANGFLGHVGSNGSTAAQRATAAGYNWTWIAENVAQGQQSENEVMTSWTNSPLHHANNISPNAKDFGLAKAGSGQNTYWTLMLGSE